MLRLSDGSLSHKEGTRAAESGRQRNAAKRELKQTPTSDLTNE
jgi:hypothetical protein